MDTHFTGYNDNIQVDVQYTMLMGHLDLSKFLPLAIIANVFSIGPLQYILPDFNSATVYGNLVQAIGFDFL